MKKDFSDLVVSPKDSVLQVLKKMDISKHKLLLVLKEGKFISLVSIGDIQRAIIKGVDLNNEVKSILRSEITVAHEEDDINKVKEHMKTRRNELMPIVSKDDNTLVDVIFWEDLFESESKKVKNNFSLPVIIMAGGFGTRLKPLTNILPKPLIPLNEKTIIEDIMDKFVDCGCSDFHISVNYKAELIEYYFDSLNNPSYNISYFKEPKPLGTAGSLHLLKDKIHETFFVSNCDILIDEDYSEILEYHKANNNEITVVAALKNFSIPYGIFTTGGSGLLKSIEEKPEMVFKINTGLYILEPHLISEIPEDDFYHITFLIEKLIKEERRVGVFPISEGSWIDVGEWKEYLKSFSGKV